LFDFADAPAGNRYNHWTYWVWGIASALAFALYIFATNSKKAPPILTAVTSVAMVLSLIAFQLQGMLITHDFQPSYLTLWFFGVFVITLIEIKSRSGSSLLDAAEWSKPLGTLFVVLLLFAQYYYPRIKASWGGGTPVTVTIYLTKDSVIRPNQAVSAQLVEESDDGFYIISPKETRAIYLPRNAVALVYFF
jgi:hypothetical protein